MTVSTEVLLTKFVTFLSNNSIVLAGPVKDMFLGTLVLRTLDSQDLPRVIADFVQQLKKGNV